MNLLERWKKWINQKTGDKISVPWFAPIKSNTAYECNHCFDCGYFITLGPIVNLGTAFTRQQSYTPCEFCERGKAFASWQEKLRRNPNMSNDVRAYYRSQGIE
jgi:hypothetical protein